MGIYNGQTCPVCQNIFTEGDDVVVCPECGTPHHRQCYKQNGGCANAALHAENYEYSVVATVDVNHANEANICEKCGAANPDSSLFCIKCGAALPTKSSDDTSGELPRFNTFAAAVGEDMIDPELRYGGLKASDTIDGIAVKEYAEYIGSNSGYYIHQFKRQELSRSPVGFVLSAAFFPHLYFAYRKMWLWALLSLTVIEVLSLPSAFLYLGEMGFTVNFDAALLDRLSLIFGGVTWAVRFLCGFFAIFLYRVRSRRVIGLVHEKTQEPAEVSAQLKKRGGVSILNIVILLAASFLLVLIILAPLAAFGIIEV